MNACVNGWSPRNLTRCQSQVQGRTSFNQQAVDAGARGATFLCAFLSDRPLLLRETRYSLPCESSGQAEWLLKHGAEQPFSTVDGEEFKFHLEHK